MDYIIRKFYNNKAGHKRVILSEFENKQPVVFEYYTFPEKQPDGQIRVRDRCY